MIQDPNDKPAAQNDDDLDDTPLTPPAGGSCSLDGEACESCQ